MLCGSRQSIRRSTDQKTQLHVDRYGHYLFLSLLLIILLSVFDAYFTIFHVDKGAREINPFMNYLIGYDCVYFFALKYILTTLGLLILCIYKNLFMVRTLILFVFLVYLGVFAHHLLLIFSE